MRPSCIAQLREQLRLLAMLAALSVASPVLAQDTSGNAVQVALHKANTYIELAKTTERAVESWERYLSWVNIKTGPTGKEEYISYGMYDLYDLDRHWEEARTAATAGPKTPDLDAQMASYMTAYFALAPVMQKAATYYESRQYEQDNAAEGQALHKQMVPLAAAFLAERDKMMAPLRVFVRDVEGQELADIEARVGRNAAWHVGQVMHAANRVIDVFPRVRPQPMSSEMLEAEMRALGPDTPPEKFEQVMSGVVLPQNLTIDVARYSAALQAYAEAVKTFEAFQGEKPDDFDEFKLLPRQLLELLQAFEEPLTKSQGHDLEGGGLGGRIVQAYFSMFNAGNGLQASQLRYLP